MHLIVLLLVTLSKASTIISHNEACEQLALSIVMTTTTTHVHLFEDRANLFVVARRLLGDSSALLTVDCRTLTMGVAFRHFTVGADCSRRRFVEIAASAPEAWPLDKTRSSALLIERVIGALDEWRSSRHCSVPGESTRAALFWLAALIVFFAMRRYAHQQEPLQDHSPGAQ